MATYQVEFESDKDATKDTLTSLISEIGELTWTGDSGTFAGKGMAGGVKGDVAVTENSDGGSSVTFSYSLPFKLKAFGGKVDGIIRKSLEKAGGRIR